MEFCLDMIVLIFEVLQMDLRDKPALEKLFAETKYGLVAVVDFFLFPLIF